MKIAYIIQLALTVEQESEDAESPKVKELIKKLEAIKGISCVEVVDCDDADCEDAD